MRVNVASILSQKDYGTIFSAVIDDPHDARHGQRIRVKGTFKHLLGLPVAGEVWDVDGTIVDTDEYGAQINASRAVRVMPTGKLIMSFLAAHAPGVGADRAALLWKRYGMELETVLSDEANITDIAGAIAPDRPHLAPRLAAACVKTWQEAKAEVRMLAWLAAQGIEDITLARRIGRILGPDAVEQLSRNPYVLVPLLPWRKVDELGKKLFAEARIANPSKDVRRLVGACDASVKALIADGHTATSFANLREVLAKRLGVVPKSPLIDQAIDTGKRNGALLPIDDGWRAPGCAAMEDSVLERLRKIMESVDPVQIPSEESLKLLLTGSKVSGQSLHPEQLAAVLNVITRPLACLQGGAGVGKTTTTQAICDLWERLGGDLVLTSLSGKAALRLSRATGRRAMTMARLRIQLEKRASIARQLLGELSDTERTKLNHQFETLAQIKPASLVIIDEASMLDLTNANALLRLMPPGARLLLVGDVEQLPPVGFGLIYHRLVTDTTITARLMVIHRQTEASGIPVVAAAIRDGKMPALKAYDGAGDGVSFIECGNEEMQSVIQRVWSEICATSDEQPPLIVTATNDGNAGIHELNKLFHERQVHCQCSLTEHRCREEVKGHLGQWFSIGEPVVFLKNDYPKGLFNGLLGTVASIDPDTRSLKAQFDGYDEEHEIDMEDMIDLQLAYAITCHKGQGSQAPAVIVPLYQTRLLDPSWLYTAVTRAQRQVVLIGSKAILREALQRPKASDKRDVGFIWSRDATIGA